MSYNNLFKNKITYELFAYKLHTRVCINVFIYKYRQSVDFFCI